MSQPKGQEQTATTKAVIPVPPVPETLLKQRELYRLKRTIRKAIGQKVRKQKKIDRVESYKRAEQYQSEYKKAEKKEIRLARQARDHANFYRPPEPKLAIVVRIKGIQKVAPKPRKTLQLLRLIQLHNARFVKLNGATLEMLRIVEPLVMWGYPNLKTVRELIYKRGFAKVKGQRLPIADNAVIKANLGKYNIICIEDLIHEIFTVGPHFKEANRFLWPFKLNSPRGGFVKKRNHFIEGGDAGNREGYINEIVRRMN
eukprot:TRINITY_DN1972_c0_g1_i1.p1 TRINITY_DN1972_c0_g1~~TRINITY_DN1972_c0_g1_i1.p1  ORF type:complete len:257 (+),score=45.01 TRINITY_DN1972_c0_g1_i1:134-904(+)